ncbi:MAG TPA: hypothetical protein VHX88_06550 [Solirubrobacteraceae bacterium]|jgi:hypothetical protein|nr:hypothetical protein [Solirubrobacteraceae bacterium]
MAVDAAQADTGTKVPKKKETEKSAGPSDLTSSSNDSAMRDAPTLGTGGFLVTPTSPPAAGHLVAQVVSNAKRARLVESLRATGDSGSLGVGAGPEKTETFEEKQARRKRMFEAQMVPVPSAPGHGALPGSLGVGAGPEKTETFEEKQARRKRMFEAGIASDAGPSSTVTRSTASSSGGRLSPTGDSGGLSHERLRLLAEESDRSVPVRPPVDRWPPYQRGAGGFAGDALAQSLKPSTESQDSLVYANDMVKSAAGLLVDMVKSRHIDPQTEKVDDVSIYRVKLALARLWGWSWTDIGRYFYAKGDHLQVRRRRNGNLETNLRVRMAKEDGTSKRDRTPKVKYLDASERRQHQVAIEPDGTLRRGRDGLSLETAGMTSKVAGRGFGIFVMAPDGTLYVGQHTVGLFHHSSFLSNEAVVAAGEIRVQGGVLREITSKSGHYQPKPRNMRTLLAVLDQARVPLNGVTCKIWIKAGDALSTRVYDARQFLDQGESAPFTEETM